MSNFNLIQQLLANFVITLAFVKYVLMPILKFIIYLGSISFFTRLDNWYTMLYRSS